MVRRIFVNDPSEIDFDNFGVHFSANNSYRHIGGGSNGTTDKKRYEVRAIVEKAEINDTATAVSNEEYPNEQEVVLQGNQKIQAKVFVIDTQEGFYVGEGGHNGYIATLNTGTRCDKWAEKYL